MTLVNYLAAVFCVLLGLGLWRRKKYSRLPPGPPAGLFGNIHHIPRTENWKAFKVLANTYGPLICFWMFSGKSIILNDYKTADSLLNRRSAIYSSRPTFWMSGYLAGRENSVFGAKTTNPRFKLYRTLLHKAMNQRAIQSYRDLQMDECKNLLKGLLETPHEFISHIRKNAVSVIMNIAYGYQVEAKNDKFVSLLEHSMALSNGLSIPGKYWIEFFPVLRFVPDWFPGAGFKKIGRNVGSQLAQNERSPFLWTKSQMTSGIYNESFVSNHLMSEDQIASSEEEKEEIIQMSSASLYVGGGDTTVSALTSFFLLMALHPTAQKRAQEEIDRFVGNRMATHQDMLSLPYVNAVIKETTRWGCVAPLGIQHQVTEDDYFDGYFFPKGTRIVANIWAMAYDENVYPDPSKFNPERFMGEKQQMDPNNFIFGFGRRICPGMHLAEVSLFVNITNILANFIISKEVGQDAKEIEPEIHWTAGVTTHLKPFPCRILPRSPSTLKSTLLE